MDMEIINSSDNKLIKLAVKLKDKKYREEYSKFLLEGLRTVKDSVKLCVMSGIALQVVLSESAAKQYIKDFEGAKIVSDKLFSSIADTVNSQGVLAIADIPESKGLSNGQFCLYLDRIRDPGNMGTMVRTAAACGFNDIVLRDCVDAFNPKAVRSSMGAVLRISFHRGVSLKELKERGYNLICADMAGSDLKSFPPLAKDRKLCLMIGNEANGLDEDLMKAADNTVSLPMENGVESLNASVSAGILMYYFRYNIR